MRILSVLSGLVLTGSILSAANGVNSQLLNLAPATSRVVAGIDVSQARNSPFGLYILSQMNNATAGDAGFQQFIQQTGFDPRSDVQQLLMVSDGKTQPNFAILAFATFDKAKMEAAAAKFGATLDHFQGVDLIVANDKHNNNQASGPGVLAFLEAGVLVAGNADTVHQIIAARAQPSTLDPTLLTQIQTTSTVNDAWVVSVVPFSEQGPLTVSSGNAKNLANAQVFQSILQASAGVQFGAQVAISADALTRSAQDATSLSDVVRFLAGMVAMQKTPDPNAAVLAKALANLVLTTKGNDVHLALTFAEHDLEQLAQSHAQANHHSELSVH